jgi:hypothetical protein
MASKHHIDDPLGVGAGAKNGALIFLQWLQQALDVGRMAGDPRGNSEFPGDKGATEVRAELLRGSGSPQSGPGATREGCTGPVA